MEGSAIFVYEMKPCQLSYHIICNAAWHTRSARVTGWVGDQTINISINVDSHQHWRMNAVDVPAVYGCIDLDLNFSPSTNTIAIRRSKMAVGQRVEITAAWLRFPSFKLEPLLQSYQRVEENLYRYESGGGLFVSDLQVNSMGYVIDYPGIWKSNSIEGG